jgi:hypothetical protein
MKVCVLVLLVVSVVTVSEVSGQFSLSNLGGICNLNEFIKSKCDGDTGW